VAIVPLAVKLRRHGFRSEVARKPAIALAISILIFFVAIVVGSIP